MKRRVLVMNGSRIVQSDSGEGWNSEKVEKAFNLKAGIYNIYTASPADKKRASSGVIVHADKDSVYQQCGKKLLCIRAMISIEYLVLLCHISPPLRRQDSVAACRRRCRS